MPRPVRRLLALASLALPILAVGHVAGQNGAADAKVSLLGWEDVGTLEAPSRIVAPHFRLVAKVQWAPNAPNGPDRYRTVVDGPDGATASFPIDRNQGPGENRLTFWVPASFVVDRKASDVVVNFRVVDAGTGEALSRTPLTATIDNFPRPGLDAEAPPDRFGWGTPLKPVAGSAQRLARKPEHPKYGVDLNDGPGGLQFARVFRQGDRPGFFASLAESRIDQLTPIVPRNIYTPNLRVAEFIVSPDSPAIGVSPAAADAYLAALGKSEGLGLTYRLPTKDEWLALARAGKETRFWWGDDPDDEAARLGANFKGPERPQAGGATPDAIDVLRPTDFGGISPGGFRPNPWGLWHTFGNVGEWATDPGGNGLWIMGGNFRTERDKANFRPDDLEISVKSADAYDPAANPFVGVRPVIEITPEAGKAAIEAALRQGLVAEARGISARYDPETATVTLSGTVRDPAVRLRADAALRPLWFLASLDDRLDVREAPVVGDGVVALEGEAISEAVACGHVPAGRVYRVPVAARWSHRLPAEGSSYWINVYQAETGAWICGMRINPGLIGRSPRLEVPIEAFALAGLGLKADAPVKIAVSLGKEPARAANDSRIVSNLATLRWRILPERDCPENVPVKVRKTR